jgi:NADH-quinone oxidoreductase subunit F
VDLHFTNAIATKEERDVVDALLDASNAERNGGERSARMAEGGRRVREMRRLLLPLLHAVQGRIGWISPGALNYLCERIQVPPAEAYGVATFYALFSTTEQPPVIAHVCDDIACKTRGADALCRTLSEAIGPEGVENAGCRAAWKRSPCLGLCEKAPAAFFQIAGDGYHDFTIAPAEAEQIAAVLSGGSYRKRAPGGSTPQSGQDGLCLLARVGVSDPASLDDYRAKGGYRALRRALHIGPAAVLREVAEAKLTGRGGAAFPTGIKWKAVAEAPVRPHYIVCNADESEPGTFKDRVLMEEDPFAVIEAMTLAGFACGAEQGYLYIRGEYPEATRRLQNAIEQARTHGLLGRDIQGREFTFDIEIRRGAGAYICGEETALLNSLEGRRGEPRNKPPFPVQSGLFGKPTVINNVETLVNVLPILAEGGAQYANTGAGNSTGTRLFCLSGCVERPGVYEIPYGGTLRELLELAGGVREGRPLQTILIGGAAGVFLRPDELDIPLTLEGARAANATLGSGVALVFDDTVDMKAILLRIAAFFRDESCGQCVPCRVGTVRQEEALQRLIASGSSSAQELILLTELEKVMTDASICGLGQTAASAISSAIHRLGLFQGGQP